MTVDNMENMSPLKKNLILILPVLLIVVIGITYLLIPIYDERSKLAADVEKQRADLQRANQQIQRLNALIAENEIKKKELISLESQLPAEKEVTGLLRQVSDLGIKAGLDTVLWRPGARTVHSSKDVYEIPVNVEMRGNYHSLGYFFSKVTELQRIVNLDSISMKNSGKGPSKGPASLVAVFSAKTYSSISDEEKKALLQAEKGKKK
jgi:type IV pilus assembly protein PilO